MSKDSSKAELKADGWLSKILNRRKNKPGGTRKRFGGPLRIIVTVLLIFAISQLLAAFIADLFLSLLHPHIDARGLLNNSTPGQFFYVALAEATAVGLVLWVLKRRGLSAGAIGLGRKPRWNDLKRAVLGFGAFYVLLIIVNALMALLFPGLSTNQTQDVGFNSLNSPLDHLLAFVGLVLLPPLGEEPLIRGYLYSGLRSRWAMTPALIVTSLLFGLAHLQTGSGAALLWTAGADTFMLSVILVYLREKTGALYAGMLVHALNNAIAFVVHFHP